MQRILLGSVSGVRLSEVGDELRKQGFWVDEVSSWRDFENHLEQRYDAVLIDDSMLEKHIPHLTQLKSTESFPPLILLSTGYQRRSASFKRSPAIDEVIEQPSSLFEVGLRLTHYLAAGAPV